MRITAKENLQSAQVVCFAQAARVYDRASREIRGDAAVCNFPKDSDASGSAPMCALHPSAAPPPPWHRIQHAFVAGCLSKSCQRATAGKLLLPVLGCMLPCMSCFPSLACNPTVRRCKLLCI